MAGGQGQYHLPDSSGPAMKACVSCMRSKRRLLKEQNLEFLFYDVEMPLSDVLFEMEADGVRLGCGGA